jgi:23S rRNA G2445 N2-methylase RlmL
VEYKFCENDNFEDYSSGRVLYGNRGIPNFPVRLINEIFRRCIYYCENKSDLTVYDPCCGGGYSLTVLGLCNNEVIADILGSDIDKRMIEYAKKNTDLLSQAGLKKRIDEIEGMLQLYSKASHSEALESAKRIKDVIKHEINIDIFEADCTIPLNIDKKIDIIITDVPYGNLVDWKGEHESGIYVMMKQLSKIANPSTVLAISMDKHEKVNNNEWKRCEKNIIGKRKFEIYKLI